MKNWTMKDKKYLSSIICFLIAGIVLKWTKYEIASDWFYLIAGAISYHLLRERRKSGYINMAPYAYLITLVVIIGVQTLKNIFKLLGVNL